MGQTWCTRIRSLTSKTTMKLGRIRLPLTPPTQMSMLLSLKTKYHGLVISPARYRALQRVEKVHFEIFSTFENEMNLVSFLTSANHHQLSFFKKTKPGLPCLPSPPTCLSPWKHVSTNHSNDISSTLTRASI